MSTFITKLDTTSGSGTRLAVKDLIDVEGVPTTAGSRAVEQVAKPAPRDAACLSGARAAGARIVGKTNLHELAMLPIGTNPWFGTPVNPLDASLIPGGSPAAPRSRSRPVRPTWPSAPIRADRSGFRPRAAGRRA